MNKISQALSVCFPQAELLITGVRPHRWDDDSLHAALRLRVKLSRQQYEFLRSIGYPLPGRTTLQRYLSAFILQPDDATTQLQLLAKMAEGMTDLERQCVIMYDEMDISQVVAYDQQLDQVLGPFRHIQVFMVAGVFSGWKLPVLYQFDTAATSTTLINLIKGVEAVGLQVVATVSDMGGSNVGVWSALGIKHNQRTWFVNPASPDR